MNGIRGKESLPHAQLHFVEIESVKENVDIVFFFLMCYHAIDMHNDRPANSIA